MSVRDVGLLGTANPSTLVEFARLANAECESLIRDIHDGTLTENIEVSPAIRISLQKHIRRRCRKRAAELERILERTGTLYPKDFWVQLAVIAVWLGGSVGVYLPLLKEYYGDTPLRDHGLSASEGHISIPIDDGVSAGILEYSSHFFEFIPEDEYDQASPSILEAHELEDGRKYYILLTTSSGFYRYDIHDVVRCVGYQGQAPVIQFVNKGAHISSITGEKLSESQVISAVSSAFGDMQIPLENFTVAPVMSDRPGYVLLLEPGFHASKEIELVERVEEYLAKSNVEYAVKRETGRLYPISIQEVPTGTWVSLRSEKTAQRGNIEQYKHPFLVNDVKFVDRIKHFGAGTAECCSS